MTEAPLPQMKVESVADQAAEFCDDMIVKVSRTFALSIQAMPETLRAPVQTAYLLCRVVDTIEDEAKLEHPVRMHLFNLFDAALADHTQSLVAFEDAAVAAGLGGDSSNSVLCANASLVFFNFRQLSAEHIHIILPCVAEMSNGMRTYCTRASLRRRWEIGDMADLERYCFYVAGTVGRLLTELFEASMPQLDRDSRAIIRESAVRFGLGLQLVNILKDIADDAERGVCFLPLAEARRHAIELDEVLDPKQRSGVLAVVSKIVARARAHLGAAIDYTLAWPLPDGLDLRMFCAVPLSLALATLQEIERGMDVALPGRNPKITRGVVNEILRDVAKMAGDDAQLRHHFSLLSAPQTA